MEKNFYLVNGLNRMTQEEIQAYREKKLSKQLKYGYDHSSFYKQKFAAAGARPEDIRTLDDLRRLPIFMLKDEERRSVEGSLVIP